MSDEPEGQGGDASPEAVADSPVVEGKYPSDAPGFPASEQSASTEPTPGFTDEELEAAVASTQEEGTDSVEEFPNTEMPSGSIAEPIRAMRVIKLGEAKKASPGLTPPRSEMKPAPIIETAEASYEELEGELNEEQISALAPSLPPGAQSGYEDATPAKPYFPPEPVTAPTIFTEKRTDPPAPPPEPEELKEDVEELVEVEDVESPIPPHMASHPPVLPTDRKPPPPRRTAKPALPTAHTPRKKPWWETLFGDDFSRAYRPMTQAQLSREVDFILESMDIPKGSVILDLACGQGEICVELSRRGYSVVGYDLSVYQLAMAGDNAQQAKQKINFLQGDMREMAFDQMFDAVICWDTSFGYFEDEKNLDVLRRVKQALKPNGRLLLDVMNRDFAAKEAPYNHWFEGDGCVCMDDMSLDWITNRLKVKRSIILDDGRSKELHYSTRVYTLSEVGSMLHDVGFRVAAVSGDIATKGAFFGPASRRIIIQAGKP